MPEPTSIGTLMNRRRPSPTAPVPAPRPGECPEHPGNPAAFCSPCAGEWKATDPDARRTLLAERIRQDCDRRFPPRYRTAVADHPAVCAWIARAVADPENTPSLLLLGAVGVGKTWQAYGALRAVAPEISGRDWIATSFPDFVAGLRPRPGGDPEREMARYRDASLILLDDLGIAKSSEWVEEITYRLIDGRYGDMRPSIFTTNLALTELKDAIGDRIASRLAEACTRVVLEGTDRRRQRPAAPA